MILNSSIEHKIIGYFSCSPKGQVFCDGDACVIASTQELMSSYLRSMLSNNTGRQDLVKKTKFGEIIRGLEQGAAYAFDKDAYARFFVLAEKYGINGLPQPNEFFGMQLSTGELHFIRIQFDELK